MLNYKGNGALDTRDQVGGWLDRAGQLLTANCPSESISAADRAEAIAISANLDLYNNGLLGVSHCGEPTNPPPSCPLTATMWAAESSSQWPSGTANTNLCGVDTWYNIVSNIGSSWSFGASQWIAAKLNIALGIDTSNTIIASVLNDFQTALCANTATLVVDQDLLGLLSAFNAGELTPGCAPNGKRRSEKRATDLGCTYTQGYWKNHASAWPAAPAGVSYTLCGDSWMDIFQAPASTGGGGNGWYSLAHQYIAARLNQYNGAFTGNVDTALSAAGNLLAANCKFIAASETSSLTNTLDGFNSGLTSVPHCGECPRCQCPSTSTQGSSSFSVSLEAGTSIRNYIVGFDASQFGYSVSPSDGWQVDTSDNQDGTWSVQITSSVDTEGVVYYSGQSSSSPASKLRPCFW